MIVCIAALGRVTLCDRRRLLCLVRQDLCVGGDGRGVHRGLLLDHLLSLLNLFALSEGDDLSIQVSEAAPILELRAKASPAITMTRSGHAAASIAGGHFTGRVNRLRKGRDLQSAPRHHTMHSPHQRAATAPIALPCPTPPNVETNGRSSGAQLSVGLAVIWAVGWVHRLAFFGVSSELIGWCERRAPPCVRDVGTCCRRQTSGRIAGCPGQDAR